MEKIDVSELHPNASCYTLSQSSVYAYSGNRRTSYVLLNNKLIWNNEQDYSHLPDNCLTYQEIANIPSSNNWVVPFYHMAAIFSCLAIFFLAYMLLIHPFWRKSL